MPDFGNGGYVVMVQTSTNLSPPLSNRTALSELTEYFPGRFQFTDTQTAIGQPRYYCGWSP